MAGARALLATLGDRLRSRGAFALIG